MVALLAIIYRRKQRNVSTDAKPIPQMPADDEYMVKASNVASAHELSPADSGGYSTHPSVQRTIQYHAVRELP
jgi:hypothetical protein